MIALVLILNALAAIGFPTTKALLPDMAPFFLSGIRLLACGIILFGYNFITTRSWGGYRKSDLWMFTKLSFFSFFIAFGVGLVALEYVTAAKASFLYNLVPFFSAIFSYFYFSEKMTSKKLLGLAIGFVGFIPILLANGTGQGGSKILGWGDLLMIFAVLSYTYGLIITRKIMLKDTYTPAILNATGMLGGAVFCLLTSVVVENNPVRAFTGYDFVMLFLAVISVVISYNLVARLLKKYTATLLSFAALIMPFFAAAFSWVLLGERITWHYFAATGAVLIGLYIFYNEELKQGYITKP